MPKKKDLDPQQILDTRKEILIPVMISRPAPRQNPKAIFPEGTVFLDANEYEVDSRDRVYFRDPFSGDSVLLSRIDTTNHFHKIKAQFIYSDLSRHTNELDIPGTNRDTIVYANRTDVEFLRNRNVVAWTKRDRSIAVNSNRKDGLQDNFYAIRSTFRHEYIHIRRTHYEEKKINNLEHAEVYKEQMTYVEFRKAPIDFQLNRILMYALHVVSAYDNRNNFNISAINTCFTDFLRIVGMNIMATIQFDHPRKKIKIHLQGQNHEFDYIKKSAMSNADE